MNGFTLLLNTMRSGRRNAINKLANLFVCLDDILDAVDDVTVGYEGNIPETELSLLKGHIPKAIHFHVKRYSISDIPQTDEEIGEWLQQCWAEKEARLRE